MASNDTSPATMNGDIREYIIEVTDNITGTQISYVSMDRHLLIDNLQPKHRYTLRVAARYTTEIGPYSQPLDITIHSPKGIYYTEKL